MKQILRSEKIGKRTGLPVRSIPGMAAVLLACAILGCAHPQPTAYPKEDLQVPGRWTAPGEYVPGTGLLNWQAQFNDPRLGTLVREALIRNLDLRATAARLESARARAQLASAGRWPVVSVGASGRRGEGPVEMYDRVHTEDTSQYGMSMQMSWEADLWGRLHDRSKAALRDVAAARADWQAARLSLGAKVTKAWYQMIGDGLQLELVRGTLESYRVSARLVRNRYESGLAQALDLRLALSNVALAEDLLQVRANALSQSKRRLQILLPHYPDGEMRTPDALPRLTQAIPAGLPSQLLNRRPDIHAARQRLAAADKRIDAARKEFLPQLRLSGNMGTSSETLRHMVNNDYGFWSLLANLTQPLFEGGRLEANLDLAQSTARQAWLEYGQTVLQAFHEVEASLTADYHLGRRMAAVRETVRQAAGAEHLALEAYANGVADIVTVLETQRRFFNAKVDLIQVQRDRLQNRVDVYLALGGSFDGGGEAL